MSAVRRGLLVGTAFLALAPAGHAATPAISASATEGKAPLAVTLTGPAGAVWELGDGTTATGASVEHVYTEPGRYVVRATAGGESAELAVTAYRLTFAAPQRATYGTRARFSGSVWPALAGVRVEIRRADGRLAYRGRTRENGGFVLAGRIRSRGPFHARIAGMASEPDAVALRPRIDARLAGTGIVGEPLRLVASVRPAGAGILRVSIWRDGKQTHAGRYAKPIGLSTRAPAAYRVRVELEPAEGHLAPQPRVVTHAVLQPSLQIGSRGAGVRALEERLRELRYALPRVDERYALDTAQAVMAFQAVEGLPRTGRVDARTWRALSRASAPRPRYRGSHIEVSKGRQFLLVVEDGKVTAAVHTSTGATGNTPIGRWRIYRKVSGWDWVLWYPMYFLRGFAIHGYPSVPAYPASHGCVRVPMWIAPRLFSRHGYGQTVYIYW